MGYKNKERDFLIGTSINKLKKLYKKEKNLKAKLRLLCAIHRKEGKTIIEIAEIVNLPKSTASDYLKRLQKGLSYLYDKKNKGAIPKLNKKQQKKLYLTLINKPEKVGVPFVFWTTKLVYFYIKREFRKEFTMHGIRKILYRMRFTRQKPRQMHYKGNIEEQERFKKNLNKRLRNILKEDLRSSFWMKPHLS